MGLSGVGRAARDLLVTEPMETGPRGAVGQGERTAAALEGRNCHPCSLAEHNSPSRSRSRTSRRPPPGPSVGPCRRAVRLRLSGRFRRPPGGRSTSRSRNCLFSSGKALLSNREHENIDLLGCQHPPEESASDIGTPHRKAACDRGKPRSLGGEAWGRCPTGRTGQEKQLSTADFRLPKGVAGVR